ncbi:hypothetical protein lerEdw1_015865 [Lerista edwardsae]|nr:hypothetical protein lerEdw1_015865 [Lerista edwardsae]
MRSMLGWDAPFGNRGLLEEAWGGGLSDRVGDGILDKMRLRIGPPTPTPVSLHIGALECTGDAARLLRRVAGSTSFVPSGRPQPCSTDPLVGGAAAETERLPRMARSSPRKPVFLPAVQSS